jgi:hypothetical protein
MEEEAMTSTKELAGDGGGSDDFNLGAYSPCNRQQRRITNKTLQQN